MQLLLTIITFYALVVFVQLQEINRHLKGLKQELQAIRKKITEEVS
jgi:hypothetical protein